MIHILPDLNYEFDSLEPHIDTETMRIHYSKHHQGYVDKLNEAIKDYPNLQDKSLEDLLINIEEVQEEISSKVINAGGGHYNHSIFWRGIGPDMGGAPEGDLDDAIKNKFGNFDNFKKEFSDLALSVFGSGWTWLVKNDSDIEIIKTANQISPIMDGKAPILALDVWEHAYYLKYQNRRGDYINAWWNLVNWKEAQNNFIK